MALNRTVFAVRTVKYRKDDVYAAADFPIRHPHEPVCRSPGQERHLVEVSRTKGNLLRILRVVQKPLTPTKVPAPRLVDGDRDGRQAGRVHGLDDVLNRLQGHLVLG